MENVIRCLKSMGTAGNFLATVLTILGTNWVITISAAAGIFTFLSNWATSLIQSPNIQAGGYCFVLFLWTTIGLVVLRDRKKPTIIRPQYDYEYALTPEGLGIILGKFPANHSTNPNEDAVNLECKFRNVSSGPMRLMVEEFRVVLDGRTSDDTPLTVETIFPRLSPKGIRSAGILRDPNKLNHMGTISIKLLYGPPDGNFVRRYTLIQNIQISFDEAKIAAMINGDIVDEKDVQYIS